jgi:hypothetical protein
MAITQVRPEGRRSPTEASSFRRHSRRLRAAFRVILSACGGDSGFAWEWCCPPAKRRTPAIGWQNRGPYRQTICQRQPREIVRQERARVLPIQGAPSAVASIRMAACPFSAGQARPMTRAASNLGTTSKKSHRIAPRARATARRAWNASRPSTTRSLLPMVATARRKRRASIHATLRRAAGATAHASNGSSRCAAIPSRSGTVRASEGASLRHSSQSMSTGDA